MKSIGKEKEESAAEKDDVQEAVDKAKDAFEGAVNAGAWELRSNEEPRCVLIKNISHAYRKLSVRIGGKTVTDIPEMITVETALSKDETYGDNLYAVFVDEKENLKVFPATYDEKEKKCCFGTDVTGNFVFVRLDDVPLSESELIKASLVMMLVISNLVES